MTVRQVKDQSLDIEFEWDDDKRTRVFEERGIDFVDASQVLVERVFEYRSDRVGEPRFVCIGPLANGTLIAVVYTMRGARLRIITARRARSNERHAYLQALAASPDEGTN